MQPDRFVKRPPRVGDIRDHHRIERNLEFVIARQQRLTDELAYTRIRINDCNDRNSAVHGRENCYFCQI